MSTTLAPLADPPVVRPEDPDAHPEGDLVSAAARWRRDAAELETIAADLLEAADGAAAMSDPRSQRHAATLRRRAAETERDARRRYHLAGRLAQEAARRAAARAVPLPADRTSPSRSQTADLPRGRVLAPAPRLAAARPAEARPLARG